MTASSDPEREYWESRLASHSGLEGVGYLGLGRAFNSWMYRARRHVFLRRMRPLLRDRGELEVLDVGSGTGFYVERWRELGARSITGSDMTEEAVRTLCGRFPESRFVRFDAGGTELPLQPEAYDAVSAMDVLFHIVDDERYRRALRNLHALLAPGGLLVFTDNFLHGHTLRGPAQVSRALEDIRSAVLNAGFEIVERRPALVLMNAPVDSRSRVLRSLWGLVCRVAARSEELAWLAGAALFPVELVLCAVLRESPTTEMMVCRKAGGS
jgi:SAM-dependent methyltransferase